MRQGSPVRGPLREHRGVQDPLSHKRVAAPEADPYFPAHGDVRYQVHRYELALDYRPASNRLRGTARLSAVAAHGALREFVLDLADFRLSLEPLGGEFALDDELAEAQRWLRLAHQSRGTAIAGGSTFIQRNIVAERILGLPRG